MQKILRKLKQFAPVAPYEKPYDWYFMFSRLVLALFICAIPFVYDASVAEVAGDPRWALNHAVVLLLSIVFFFKLMIAKPNIRITGKQPLINWLMIGLMLWVLVSAIDTINPFRSWWYIKHYIGFIGLFFLISSLWEPRWWRALLWAMVIPVIFNSALGIIQFLDIKDVTIATKFWFWPHSGVIDALTSFYKQAAPPAGTFANKNLLASWLVLTLPLAAYLFLTSRSLIAKFSSWLAFTLGLVLLAYTRTRASWLGLIFAIICFIIWIIIQKDARISLFATLTKLNLIGIVVCISVFSGMIQLNSPLQGYHSIGRPISEQFSTIKQWSPKEFGARMAYNLNGLDIIKDYWFNGVGVGAFHTIYPLYHNAVVPTPRVGYNVTARPQRAHDDVLEAFITLGIPGGVLYCAIFIMGITMCWKLMIPYSRLKRPDPLPLFLGISLLGFGLNCLGDFPLQMPTAPIVLMVILAIITGAYKHAYPHNTISLIKPVQLNKYIILAILLLTCALSVFIIIDNAQRRAGDIFLKQAMANVMGGDLSARVKLLIDNAYEAYPWNERTEEYRAVIYANVVPDSLVPLDERITVIEGVMRYDPYAANHTINLANQYFKKAERAKILGNTQAVPEYASRIEDFGQKLQISAPFSAHTYVIQAMPYVLRDMPYDALTLYNKALEIDPHFAPAVNMKKLLERRLVELGLPNSIPLSGTVLTEESRQQ